MYWRLRHLRRAGVVFASAFGLLVVMAVIFCFWRRRRRRGGQPETGDALSSLPSVPDMRPVWSSSMSPLEPKVLTNGHGSVESGWTAHASQNGIPHVGFLNGPLPSNGHHQSNGTPLANSHEGILTSTPSVGLIE